MNVVAKEGVAAPAPPVPSFDRARFRRLFFAVMLPMFLAAVDQTLLATATPVISRELGGLRDTSWLAVAYLLASVVMVPVYGRLGDRFGRRRLLGIAIVAAPARPQPELLRDHLHLGERRRAGPGRPRGAPRELAVALPRQPAALRVRLVAAARARRRRSSASCGRQARRRRHRAVRPGDERRPDLALVGRASLRLDLGDQPGAVRGGRVRREPRPGPALRQGRHAVHRDYGVTRRAQG
ncbi:MAG: MFS transporter [Burkholderiales bacterium]|nr:MFS transporter [Burkholderiales bacterium]